MHNSSQWFEKWKWHKLTWWARTECRKKEKEKQRIEAEVKLFGVNYCFINSNQVVFSISFLTFYKYAAHTLRIDIVFNGKW